ncbi:MAG: hypothetical protein ACJ76H_03835 [Bacteriovoracaceae bacterium]
MRLFVFILLLVSMEAALASENVFAPFREGISNYVTATEAATAQKKLKKLGAGLLDEAHVLLEESASKTEIEEIRAPFEHLIFSRLKQKQVSSEVMRSWLLSLIDSLRADQSIDDAFHRLMLEHIRKTYPAENETVPATKLLKLKDYVIAKKSLQSFFEELAREGEASGQATDLPVFPLKHFKFKSGDLTGLTAREHLIYNYRPNEIRARAQLMSFTLRVMDAEETFTTIKFRDGSAPLVLEHSQTEQYRLALRLMRMKKIELEREIGKSIRDIDLIIAAFESGIIAREELSLIVNNKDFYLPEVPFIRKALGFVGQLSITALSSNPVTAPYVLIPMIIYNTYVEMKNSGEKVDEDSFLFEAPERKR